ncbi:iron chelate uptake ABC transporter family permease subunit [Modestobacter sp. VKM Ac-2983]|uniref:FecCD family ABC transporter permease n=1 Tax=Modestobacter sp. VKM Ac-2983 TaxID=3004137 RepID=UPI0022ABBEDC|nr:iron chelate uptake ABC transporter family permease subunit [Modestobacter sp. VKM Ac-2983]MCZ2805973.1 iron chelate uptake ABC transporter family permease subunit [Modestobacter sp. VKM Ac-2983]
MSTTAPARATPPRPRPRRPLRVGRVSTTYRVRDVLVPIAVFLVLVLAAAVSLGRGDYPIGVPDVLGTLVGLGDETQRLIVLELRAPRIAVAVLVGVALGLSGALIQTFARNPLASPDILGVTGGAAIGAVSVIVLGGTGTTAAGVLGGIGVPAAALLGGMVVAFLVFGLAWRQGVDGYRLVLIGIALSAMAHAIVNYLLTRSAIWDAAAANVWITGSLNGRGWDQALPLAVALLVLLPAALALSRVLGVLQYGDETARALGVRVPLAQGVVVVVAVCLAAFAVSAAGPIQFVALVVPQIAVRLTAGSRPPLVTSALLGALLLVSSDLVARTVLPESFPVGVITAIVGAPYLLWLLVRGRRRSTL